MKIFTVLAISSLYRGVKVVKKGKREQIEGLSTCPIVVELNDFLQYFPLASPL